MPPVGAAIAAITAGITATVSATLVAVGGWSGIVAFFSTPFGSLILGVGLQLVTSLFIRKPQAPSIEASKVNVRLPEPERWMTAGKNRQGGGVIFAEFDADGNFWYVIVHADSILTETVALYFDDEVIDVDVDGIVTSDNFLLKGDGKFQIFTTTHTEADATPPAIAEFKTAFAGVWTDDHKLVGTTYSAIKISPISANNRYKVFRWRGAIGIGEPSFSIVGNWSNVYDPRDVTQTLGVPATYKFSRNPVLLWAWFRTNRYGRNKPASKINWDKVAEQASICDATRTDVDAGIAPFWRCDISVPESTERTNGEQQILMSCDAQLVFDDDGKCWARVGHYYAPSLKLVRNRDIVAMESVEAQNGESLTQGVIVRYIDPDANYTAQPCAPYVNPFYYVEGETPKYLVVDALAIQNHRQAMQLAKSISHRSQSPYKLLPTVGLRGLRARQERIFELLYDNEFAGDHEIVTPTEVDASGAFVGFGCVPIDENRWVFLDGEEKSKPITVDSLVFYLPTLPTGIVVEFINNEIKVSFDAAPREDWSYEFQYQLKPDGVTIPDDAEWLQMNVPDDQLYAISGGVIANSEYFVRWRAISTGGETSSYISPIPTISTSSLTLTGTPVVDGALTEFVSMTPSIALSEGDYIRKTDGALIGNALWENVFYTIVPGNTYKATGRPNSTIVALLTFYDGADAYISILADALATQYTDYEFVAPEGAVKVGIAQKISETIEIDLKEISAPVVFDSFTIAATGGQSPYLFTDIYGLLPPGLSINPATGVVSGTPTLAGVFSNIVIRVSDNVGNFKNFPEFNITIGA